MKFALVASLVLLPGFALTSFQQDVWYVTAHHSWRVESPVTYWGWTLVALALLVVITRKVRA